MSKASEWVRTTFQAGDDLRNAGLTTPEDIIRYPQRGRKALQR